MKNFSKIVFGLIFFFLFSFQIVKADSTNIIYQTHVQNIGWQGWASNGGLSGTTGQSLRLEGIRISLSNQQYSGGIQYQTHVQNIGWQGWVSNGDKAGTTGKSLRLEAIKIQLTGEMAEYYDIYYRVHIQNVGWTGWAKNGEAAGSAGYSYRLEGIKIVLVEKGGNAPGTLGNCYFEKMPSITYQTHVQNIGWQGYVGDGSISGTSGQSLRLEGIKIKLDNGVIGGNIEYKTHIQNIGWTGWTSSGGMSGTTGQSLRLEAIRIKLTGKVAELYDVYYRVHIENFGWTGWTLNGEKAGSEGYSYRLEAIQIRLIRKGDPTPSIDYNAFHLKSRFDWYVSGGVKYLSNNKTGLIGRNVKKIIDVSSHNKRINWNALKGNIDGVILRVGYGSGYEDTTFAYNLSEVRRLGIPYGIYLFSYAENTSEATSEATFVQNEIRKYNLNPTLGVYYDIESWCLGGRCPYIDANTYHNIIKTFIDQVRGTYSNTWVYTYLNYTRERLNPSTLDYVRWIAQYNDSCTYTGAYDMWQYSSTEKINGISTNVDVSVKFR